MIVFLDTSALVKLYVQEDGSDDIRRYVGTCDAVMVSAAAYPEARAALARVYRDGSLGRGGKTGTIRNRWRFGTVLTGDLISQFSRASHSLYSC